MPKKIIYGYRDETERVLEPSPEKTKNDLRYADFKNFQEKALGLEKGRLESTTEKGLGQVSSLFKMDST